MPNQPDQNTQVQPQASSSSQMSWGFSLRHPGGGEIELNFTGDEKHLNALRSALPPILNNASGILLQQSEQQAILSLPPNTFGQNAQTQLTQTGYTQPNWGQTALPATHPTVPFDQPQIESNNYPLTYLPPSPGRSEALRHSRSYSSSAGAESHLQLAGASTFQPEAFNPYYDPLGGVPTQLQQDTAKQTFTAKLLSSLPALKVSTQKLKEDFTAKPLAVIGNTLFWTLVVLALCANPVSRNFINGVPFLNSIVRSTDGLNPLRQFYNPQPTQPKPQPPQSSPPQGQMSPGGGMPPGPPGGGGIGRPPGT